MDRRTIVVAQYKEDLSWTEPYKEDVVVIKKKREIPNIGREPYSYIWYILQNYDNLEGKYFFLQGNPLDHCPGLAQELSNTEGDFRWFSDRSNLVCDLMGRPHDSVNIQKFLQSCGITYNHNTITFTGCCLFMLSAQRIKSKPREYYALILNAITSTHRGEYAFERCVGILFNTE